MNLIDKDKLVKEFNEKCIGECACCIQNDDYGDCSLLVNFPVEDLEVVRCKDCKYNDDGECVIKAGWFPVSENWFCADGERWRQDDPN